MSTHNTASHHHPFSQLSLGEISALAPAFGLSDEERRAVVEQEARQRVEGLAESAVGIMVAMAENEDLQASTEGFERAIGELGLSHLVHVESDDPITRLVNTRHKLGLTQRDVARLMGCAHSYISRLENGYRSGKGVERVRALLDSGILEARARPLIPDFEFDPLEGR